MIFSFLCWIYIASKILYAKRINLLHEKNINAFVSMTKILTNLWIESQVECIKVPLVFLNFPM